MRILNILFQPAIYALRSKRNFFFFCTGLMTIAAAIALLANFWPEPPMTSRKLVGIAMMLVSALAAGFVFASLCWIGWGRYRIPKESQR